MNLNFIERFNFWRKVMQIIFRTIAIFLLPILVFGCGDKTSKSDGGKKSVSPQFVRNLLGENISLLAAKHGIDEDQLKGVSIEYEKMTQGYSLTEMFYKSASGETKEKPYVDFQNLVDVGTTLDRLSEKYRISKMILSEVIIEHKMLAKQKSTDN